MKNRERYFFIGIVLLSFVFTSCLNSCSKEEPVVIKPPVNHSGIDTSAEFNIQYANHTGWTYNSNIYEVNVRQYTQEGTFDAFSAHLPRLQNMGVDILWLMPINPIGEENRAGTLGSYYAVKDYEDVNPEFGSYDDFKDLVADAHKAGMHVVVDWVANHTAWDNYLTTTDPDFYLLTADDDFQSPPGQDWADVIQLDFSNEALQDYMIETLKKWVLETGIDGFRFDYVEGVPSSFWSKASAELKALKPDILLIAEGQGTKWHNMGFDMDYCWTLHGWDSGLMRQIFEGKKTVFDLDNFLNAEKTTYMPTKYRMYFTSNHDENSWHGTEFEQLGQSYEAFAVLTQTLYGMPLLYSGQEAALGKRLSFFDKDQILWNYLKYEDFYTRLNTLRDTCQALWLGEAGGLPIRINTNTDEKVFAYSRVKESSKVIVLLNLSGSPVSFKLSDDKHNGEYKNVLSDDTFELSFDKTIELDRWGHLVLAK